MKANQQTCVVLDTERWGTSDSKEVLEQIMMRKIALMPPLQEVMAKLDKQKENYWRNCFHLDHQRCIPLGIVRDEKDNIYIPFLREEVSQFAVKAERVVIVTEEEFARLLLKHPNAQIFARPPEPREAHLVDRFGAISKVFVEAGFAQSIVTAIMVPATEEIEIKTKTAAGGPSIGECYPGGIIQHIYMSDNADNVVVVPVIRPVLN